MSTFDIFIYSSGLEIISLNNGQCVIESIPEGDFNFDVKGYKLTINGLNRNITLNLSNVVEYFVNPNLCNVILNINK